MKSPEFDVEIRMPFCPFTLVTSKRGLKKVFKSLNVEADPDKHWCDVGAGNTLELVIGGANLYIVTLDIENHDSFPGSLALLVHECEHVKQHYFKWAGQKKPSSEYEAYVIQSIFLSLYPTFAKGWDKKLKQDQENVL